jgi:hypothetical protein
MGWLAAAASLLLAGALLAACGTSTPSPTPGEHAGHDAVTARVMTDLEIDLGMAFAPAGPHHELGKAPDGVELDLVGIPVEEVVLSVPDGDPDLGLAYLPYLRDLLHGPDRVYDWVAAMLACHSDADQRTCEERFAQGNLEARFSDGGPGYAVLTISRP